MAGRVGCAATASCIVPAMKYPTEPQASGSCRLETCRPPGLSVVGGTVQVGTAARLILHRVTATGSRAAAPVMGWQALFSSMRGRTDCHSPGTPGHGARSRPHPTVERQAGSPDNSARPRWVRSAGTHRWCGLQAPSRRALAMSTNRPAPDAAGGAAAGGRAVCGVCFVPR